MRSSAKHSQVSPKILWTGRIISALAVLFLLFDGALKLFKTADVVDVTVRLGYEENIIVNLGIVLIASTVIYMIPRTTVLGAILLTGYLGGAIATHVRRRSAVLYRLSRYSRCIDLGRALPAR